MVSRILHSQGESHTVEIGAGLAGELGWPGKILLYGGLGAGKTALTRGLARGYGLQDLSLVHSPTFTLINEYRVEKGTIFHIDLYRLDSMRDLYSIGLEEILWNEELVIIEWAEKLQMEVCDPIRIEIRVCADEAREITLRLP